VDAEADAALGTIEDSAEDEAVATGTVPADHPLVHPDQSGAGHRRTVWALELENAREASEHALSVRDAWDERKP
jgi:hypothetical protein